MKREKHFKSEADLCDAFMAWAKVEGFIVYPETAGWDILCVTVDGFQLGIEAKLDLNFKVIAQAMKGSRFSEQAGPDYRGILVPEGREGADDILAHVGIELFVPQACHGSYRRRGVNKGDLKWEFDRDHYGPEMFDWNPKKRCELPEFVPEVRAGVPSPISLTPWKVGALKVLALLEVRGFVTRDDVRGYRNDPRRWCASDGWLTQLGGGKWGAGRAPRFDLQHHDVYATILAAVRANLLEKVA